MNQPPQAAANAKPAEFRGWKRTFTALKYPNFRYWFSGQIVSLLGSWMQITAQGFLVYQLTGSPAFLGYVGFASGLPSWLFMLYGGVIADRISRRNLLIITQTAMMILAFILAALTFLKMVQPWQIIILAFLLGTANAFDAPARLALVKELVEPGDMTNAIALNATMFNTALITGPALAGIVYATVGPAWCFAINGISFLAVIIALQKMKLESVRQLPSKGSTLTALSESFVYVFSHKTILALISMVGMVALFGMSFITLLPAWAVQVLGGDVRTNGLLQAARGLGALIGSLIIASLGRISIRGKFITAGSFAMPILMVVFSFITKTPPALLLMVAIGIATINIMNLSNSSVQTSIEDRLRGRVMSIYSLVFFGLFPIGSMLIGQVAVHTSEQLAVRFGAIVVFAFAVFIWVFVPQIRKLK